MLLSRNAQVMPSHTQKSVYQNSLDEMSKSKSSAAEDAFDPQVFRTDYFLFKNSVSKKDIRQ